MRVAALGVAAVVGGAALVPVLDPPQALAHSHTQLCSELVGQAEDYIYADFPEPGAAPVETDQANYTYSAELDKILGTLKEPTLAYMDRIPDEWATEPLDSQKRLEWSYKQYLAATDDPASWEGFKRVYGRENRAFSSNLGFERASLSALFPMDTADWMCRDTNLQNGQTTSAVNQRRQQLVNVTPGNSVSQAQLNSYRDLTRSGFRAHHVFGSTPSTTTAQQVRASGASYSVQNTNGVQTNPIRPSSGSAFNPRGSTWQPSGGAVQSRASVSGSNPLDNQKLQSAKSWVTTNNPRSFGPLRLGGIDWTSLELRYVSDDPDAGEFDYAFSADELPGEADSFGGEATLDLSSDALFTWLALEPGQFWVNLNPDQPDKIIDEQFARTEAGRVLLEADFELKSTLYANMHPDTESGAEFFEALEPGPNGELCWGSWRMWIDPLPASAREDGDQLYILDSPLRVQMEPFEVDAAPPGPSCEDLVPESVLDANTQVLIEHMTPLIEEAVNTAPEYADLRRVYTARIAAEWLRQRDAVRPGAFHDIIGSRDVSQWPVREGWEPQDVYDAFLEARETVQFRYEYEHGGLDYYMDVTGGIEFPEAPRDPMPEAQFEQEHPTLPKSVRSAKYEAVPDRDVEPEAGAGTAWLGGGTLDKEPSSPEPTPTPTPDPGEGDGPGDDPDDEPGDGPGAGAGTDEPGPSADGPPADDELAATGFSGLWQILTALTLLLAGAALIVARARLRQAGGPGQHVRRP
ncbi:hypothetical protein ACH47X_23600 [Promicromonospora kroppenstedtii]|uniref:Uncharacterized protein n=1 Tax=Promicromonospora kroppenstedtii TaxID=440482 RepID=A0ABW7XRF0_9MICO